MPAATTPGPTAASTRVEQLVGDEPLADMSRMSPGGFETFVSA